MSLKVNNFIFNINERIVKCGYKNFHNSEYFKDFKTQKNFFAKLFTNRLTEKHVKLQKRL